MLNDNTPMSEAGKIIRSTSKALTVTSQNFIELREEINRIYQFREDLSKRLRIATLKFYSLTILHLLSFLLIFGFFYKKIAEVKSVIKNERENLNIQLRDAFVKLTFASADQFEKSWLNCLDAFDELMTSERIWDITFSQKVDAVKERTTAETAFKRTRIYNSQKEIPFLKSDVNHIFIPNANGPDLFLFPTFLLLYKNHRNLGIFDPKEITVTFDLSRFIEEEQVPQDTEIEDYTWKKKNRNGSMDKRFKDNYQIPIVTYGILTFQSKNGLEESFMFSNFNAFNRFQEAYNYHILQLK